jgi:hypothetical protein
MTKSRMMLLIEARKRALFVGDKWPDVFMPWQLANLQYQPGTADWANFWEGIKAALAQGRLVTSGIQTSDWYAIAQPNLDLLKRGIERGEIPANFATWAISRDNFSLWLTAIEEHPSELVTAWMDAAPVVAETRTPAKRKGVSRNTILNAPWPKLPGKRKMESLMSDVPEWLHGAIEDEGKAPTPHTWSPARIADALASPALHKKWTINRTLLNTFIEKHFSAYLDEWERLSEYRSNTGTS